MDYNDCPCQLCCGDDDYCPGCGVPLPYGMYICQDCRVR